MPSSDDLHVAACAQRLCEDSWTLEERMSIEEDRERPVGVDARGRVDAALERLFAAATRAPAIADERPTPKELIAFVDGSLAQMRRQFVEQCAQRCPEIQEEIQLLRRLGSNPLSIVQSQTGIFIANGGMPMTTQNEFEDRSALMLEQPSHSNDHPVGNEGELMHELEPHIDPSLYQNKKEFAAEIVYEVTTQANRLPFGIAFADIKQSVSHFHKRTTETYTVVQGDLEVRLDGEKYTLGPGDVIKISPGAIHSARSLGETPARITVTSIPEWSSEDYHVAEGEAGAG
jgi:mannose-6-phosphate isomerase-like protein (cupin superfamily)